MGLLSKKTKVFCPISGRISPLEYCPDEVFSKGMTGEGVVIFPTKHEVYAPFDATVEFVFESKHAIALKGSGIECLIHVGLETNQLKGKGFDVKVTQNQKVKQGDLLLTFDSEVIKNHNCIDATPFVFTNLHRKDFTVTKYGNVNANEEFITVERR